MGVSGLTRGSIPPCSHDRAFLAHTTKEKLSSHPVHSSAGQAVRNRTRVHRAAGVPWGMVGDPSVLAGSRPGPR